MSLGDRHRYISIDRRNLVGAHAYDIDPLFWNNMVIQNDGCWIPTTKGNAHGKYKIIHRSGQYFTAHRYAFRLFNGEASIVDGLHICHHCDNPPCANPHHLFQGTESENKIDMALKGRAKDQVLTVDDVRLIRKMYATGKETNQTLGDKFGVTRQHIHKITVRKKWAHVK